MTVRFDDADEARHEDAPVEAWWFWGSTVERDAGLFVGLELRGRRFDYWAGLVREGMPYLYVEELDGTGLRSGLEIKPPQMWADHSCDLPFRQWSLGNESHGVLLDDPSEAWRRARHARAGHVRHRVVLRAAMRAAGSGSGYRQPGEIDARVELTEGVLALVGPAERVHVWGTPYLPASFAMPHDTRSLRAPYRRSDGVRVDQVLTSTWWAATQ